MAATEAQLRSLLQDPSGAAEKLSTADYSTIIALEDNVYRAAALGARAIAAKYAAKTDVKAGPVSVANSDKYEHYIGLAMCFDLWAGVGGGATGDVTPLGPELTGVSVSGIEAANDDADRYGSAFRRGMTDNPPTDTLREETGAE
jgi:hypothetical protein